MALTAFGGVLDADVEVDARVLRGGRDAVDAREHALARRARARRSRCPRRSRWMLSGSSAVGRDAVDAPALERQHDARSSRPRMRSRPPPRNVGVRHLERERLRLERQRRRSRARRAARDPSPSGSNVTSIPSSRAPTIDNTARASAWTACARLAGCPRTPRGTRPSSRFAMFAKRQRASSELEVMDDDARRVAMHLDARRELLDVQHLRSLGVGDGDVLEIDGGGAPAHQGDHACPSSSARRRRAMCPRVSGMHALDQLAEAVAAGSRSARRPR